MQFRAIVVMVLITLASPAGADAIPGDWCPPDGGRTLQITTSGDVTFAGKPVKAKVTQHNADFVIPDGETDVGARFSATQLNDNEIRVTIAGRAPEIWTPCKPIS